MKKSNGTNQCTLNWPKQNRLENRLCEQGSNRNFCNGAKVHEQIFASKQKCINKTKAILESRHRCQLWTYGHKVSRACDIIPFCASVKTYDKNIPKTPTTSKNCRLIRASKNSKHTMVYWSTWMTWETTILDAMNGHHFEKSENTMRIELTILRLFQVVTTNTWSKRKQWLALA